MDLMIHDLDIVMSLNKSNIKSIKASGASVLTDTTDIANARVEFENGCVCNLSASRISDKIERKMRVFQKNSYFSLDYQACKLDSYKKIVVEENKKIEKTRDTFLENDPLNEEVKSFINCIKENKKPLVDAVDGIKALKYAITISNLIKK
jgi:predicted dehydrogenase